MATTTEEASHLYEASATLRENRARYLEKNGFGDGGYEDSWVTLKKVGPINLGIPNTAGRKRVIRLHDLHHVIAQYGTNWSGEGEIGAFEIGAGCAHHYAAWFLNASAMSFGVFIAPTAVYRAYVRGRHARALYDGEWREELLDERTGDMRKKLGLEDAPRPATFADNATFAMWAIGTPLVFYGPFVVPVALAVRALLT